MNTHIKILYIKDEDVLITVLRMYWESDIVEKQIMPKYNLYGDLYNSEIPLIVKNADTLPNTLTIITENYNEKCSLSGVSTFSYQIYDLYNNIQTLNKDIITAYLQNEINSSIKITCGINYDSSNYIYTTSFTITTSGEYNLYISILVNGVSEHILSSFKTFSCCK
jgi:hypothetical protein